MLYYSLILNAALVIVVSILYYLFIKEKNRLRQAFIRSVGLELLLMHIFKTTNNEQIKQQIEETLEKITPLK